ncbi:Kelch repeat-containing protein-like protein 5 [Seiridium cupressi]
MRKSGEYMEPRLAKVRHERSLRGWKNKAVMGDQKSRSWQWLNNYRALPACQSSSWPWEKHPISYTDKLCGRLHVASTFMSTACGYDQPPSLAVMMPQLHRSKRARAGRRSRSLRESSSTASVHSTAFATTRMQHRGIHSTLSLLATIVLSLFSTLSLAQRDPVANFCRRFGHQTAVIDRKLYIDGGFINYAPLPSNPTNYSNTFLSYHDLDHIGPGGMPQLYSNLSKNATIPSVNGGILWADGVNKKFYLFGGEYYQTPPSELALYSYDTLNNYWTTFDDTPSSISSVSYGAGISVSEIGEAFYYGGWMSDASNPEWTGTQTATTGLIHYVMDENRWNNITGPDDVGRAEGAMVYLPASDGGLLVYFGGIQDPGNGSITGQPMDEIFVFDMASSRWYKQVANGDIPGMRARFCAGVTWAEDRSSYNVYLYGGLGMPNYTSGYDDVYILSMPSFTWIKMYPNTTTLEQYPHHSLSCNVIDGSQMIIAGGSFPLDDHTCDVPEQYGTHGLDLGEQNEDTSPWFLYRPNITEYVVPSIISDIIGGNSQGAATKTAPDNGFDEPDLRILMSRKYTAPVRTPTRDVSPPTTSPSSSLSSGAIAGIAVGAAVVVVVLFTSVWFCCRRQRRKRQGQSTPAMSSVAPMHSHTHSGNGSMWSPGSSHQTPGPPSPYGAGHNSVFMPGGAVIPNHPIEMPGHVHGSGASEIDSHQGPHSAISGVSPGGGDPTKYGYEWPSPMREVELSYPLHENNKNVYSGGGYGPQELSADPTGDASSGDERRHETFYHSRLGATAKSG